MNNKIIADRMSSIQTDYVADICRLADDFSMDRTTMLYYSTVILMQVIENGNFNDMKLEE